MQINGISRSCVQNKQNSYQKQTNTKQPGFGSVIIMLPSPSNPDEVDTYQRNKERIQQSAQTHDLELKEDEVDIYGKMNRFVLKALPESVPDTAARNEFLFIQDFADEGGGIETARGLYDGSMHAFDPMNAVLVRESFINQKAKMMYVNDTHGRMQ